MITVPINPSSSPATAKIKSVWGSGIKLPFFYRSGICIIQPFSPQLAGTDRHDGILLLVSICRVIIRVKPCHNTCHLITFDKRKFVLDQQT